MLYGAAHSEGLEAGGGFCVGGCGEGPIWHVMAEIACGVLLGIEGEHLVPLKTGYTDGSGEVGGLYLGALRQLAASDNPNCCCGTCLAG